MNSKVCTLCKIIKNYCEFYNNKGAKDGLTSWCKDCKKTHDNCSSHLEGVILGKINYCPLITLCNCGSCSKYSKMIIEREKGQINFTTVDNKIIEIPIGQSFSKHCSSKNIMQKYFLNLIDLDKKFLDLEIHNG